MEEKRKFVVDYYLTRAEYLSEKEQKKLGKKEGLVINESALDEEELKKEFDEILVALKKSEEEGIKKYISFMIESVSFAIKRGKSFRKSKR